MNRSTLVALALAATAIASRARADVGPETRVARATPAPGAVHVVRDAFGQRLQVDGRDFFVVGMNWDYVPIGENYNYSLWTKPDDVIRDALAREMPLLKRMGVNAIRQYAGVPARWIAYIYNEYGIYTVLNPTVGRYGHSFDGVWTPQVDYSDPDQREALKAEVRARGGD
jgi:hypothetical protein